jgi:hypothetical protein
MSRGHGGRGHEPRGRASPWAWGYPVAYVFVDEADEDADEQREFGEKPSATVGARAVVLVSPRAVGEPLGAALNDAWGGPGGLGAHYLARDERALDWHTPSPDDSEPEWQFGD